MTTRELIPLSNIGHLETEFPLLTRALRLIQLGHKGQLYNSRPYWHHPVRVALRLKYIWNDRTALPELLYSALFHDLVEDSSLRPIDLCTFGFSDGVAETVGDLTHDEFDTRTYQQYVEDLTKLEGAYRRRKACLIKLADLVENINGARFLPLQKRGRVERYGRAIDTLLPVVKNLDPRSVEVIMHGEQDKDELARWFGEEPGFL